LPDYWWQTIKAGEGIIASTQSANRDETVFDKPDEFNIRRYVQPFPHSEDSMLLLSQRTS